MSRPQIGKAKYGNVQKKFWKLKDGDQVYGILPPLGELAKDGKWSIYYKVHYGYKNAAGKSRPFQNCEVKNRKSQMIEIPDAAQDRINMLKGKLETAKKSKDKNATEALFKLVGGQKSLYNCDNNHYLNAIDSQGNIGILKLRHKAKLALDGMIKELREKGVDPLGLENRRFFVFNRTGNAMDTTFKVTVLKKKLTVDGLGEVEQDVVHNLTDDVLDRLSDEAAELHKIFKTPTAEQVAQIVKESDLKTGTSPNIDSILGFSTTGTNNDEEIVDDPNDDEGAEQSTAPVATQTVVPAVETKAASAVTPTIVEETKAPVAKTVEAKKETQAVASASPKPTTAEALSSMSDADFLAYLDQP